MKEVKTEKEFPKEVKLTNKKAVFLVGIWEYNSNYLGWALYYIPGKEEFVTWIYNNDSRGCSGGHYLGDFSSALVDLKDRAGKSVDKGERVADYMMITTSIDKGNIL